SVSAVTAVSPGADGSSDTWQVTIAGGTGTAASNGITVNLAGVRDIAGNAGVDTVTVPGLSYSIDNTVPTASITLSDNRLAAGETAEVTIAFSERVTGFELEDLAVGNGTLSNLRANADGRTWTATLTPTATGAEGAEFHVTLNAATANVRDLVGNALQANVSSAAYTLDRMAPQLAADPTISHTALGPDQPTTSVTIKFSEAVGGFGIDDVTLTGGSVSAVTAVSPGADGSSDTWQVTIAGGTGTAASNGITVNLAGVMDIAGNAGVDTATVPGLSYSIDNTVPTATITLSDNRLAAGETAEVTIAFSERVTGFELEDLAVGNGTLSNLRANADARTWTATLTPTATGVEGTEFHVTLNAATANVRDLVGNALQTNVSSAAYTLDRMAPQLAASNQTISHTALGPDQPTTSVTIKFSEAVGGFGIDDVTLTGGSVSAVTAVSPGADGSSDTWQVTIAGGTGTAASNGITVNLAGVMDVAGNAGVGTATVPGLSYSVDNTVPTATITLSDNRLAAGETAEVTIAFSERVTGFELEDLVVGNGTLSNLRANADGRTWTATLTPTATGAEGAEFHVTLNAATANVRDLVGNALQANVSSAAYTLDRMAPQLAADPTISHTALGPDQPTTSVTIKFSEAVGGFGIDDVTLTGGSVSAVTAVSPGADGSSDTWQVTIAGGTGTAASNGITVNLAGVRDIAGNAGVGTATVPGLSYSVDNTVPTASITLSDNRLAAGETTEVTIAFSERVTGFELEDLAAGNGTLSNLRANADGRTWTATLTPTATGAEGAEFHVTLNAANANVRDLVGNALQTNVSSAAYTLDRMAPQLAASDQAISHTALGPDQPTTSVTIKFNEAVGGFGIDDVTLTGGSVSAVTAVNSGADGSSDTWQVTIAGGTGTAASNSITVNLAGVRDIAGNAGVGTTTVPGLSYSVDNTVPTATITLSDNRLAIGETLGVTVQF
ncbi:Ig-like domain-containing protein, partial [Verminephrobacter aporrectodeae]|uniref:Ig-like domain-containing protein n=2 Tax=Verminephrobacter aporrectodeae TaxID=1110389 RepID=UPI0022438BBD